jgi:predicted RNA-binding Zn ribbon-like protein
VDDREQTETWPRIGGHVVLDFVNTVGGLPSTADDDAIATYEQLLLWSELSETITSEHARRLEKRARRSRAQADEALRDAHALRRDLYALLDGLRTGSDTVDRDWKVVRPRLVSAMEHASPSVDGQSVRWSWAHDADLAAPLHPIALAAGELMTSEDLALVRRCGRCRFLFLDRSRNHSRRWCNMRTCGFADKVERQLERRHAAREDG